MSTNRIKETWAAGRTAFGLWSTIPSSFSAELVANPGLDYVCVDQQHGIIDTEMMQRFSGGTPEGRAAVIAQEPIGRMGTPEEIAAAVLWLCSDMASFIVGHAMVADGGQTV